MYEGYGGDESDEYCDGDDGECVDVGVMYDTDTDDGDAYVDADDSEYCDYTYTVCEYTMARRLWWWW